MTNATSLKYHNLYTVNRNYNPVFDAWIKSNYTVSVSYEVWSYGAETFIDKTTGERIYSESKIMQRYVKTKQPYFRNFDDVDEYFEIPCNVDL